MATPKEQHDAQKHPINYGENAPDAALQQGDTEVPPAESSVRTGQHAPITGGGAGATGGRGTGTEG
jgi:hypothetical protein